VKKVGKFNIRIVETGDKYGRWDSGVNDKAPMVEFYDSRFDHAGCMGRGQFVSRYYVDTIVNGTFPNGLDLHGGEPEWKVSAEEMRDVKDYLGEQA